MRVALLYIAAASAIPHGRRSSMRPSFHALHRLRAGALERRRGTNFGDTCDANVHTRGTKQSDDYKHGGGATKDNTYWPWQCLSNEKTEGCDPAFCTGGGDRGGRWTMVTSAAKPVNHGDYTTIDFSEVFGTGGAGTWDGYNDKGVRIYNSGGGVYAPMNGAQLPGLPSKLGRDARAWTEAAADMWGKTLQHFPCNVEKVRSAAAEGNVFSCGRRAGICTCGKGTSHKDKEEAAWSQAREEAKARDAARKLAADSKFDVGDGDSFDD